MQSEEIERRIESFSRWHYEFDLQGHKTPIYQVRIKHRHRNRAAYFFDTAVSLLGGSLEGKRVLDLGCNAGWWSLKAIEAGADYVLGIDGREMHVEQSEFVFEALEIEDSRYDFKRANIFDVDFSEHGKFDVVLLLGLLYHISKPIDLMERIAPVNDDMLIVDTAIAPVQRSIFEVRRDSLDEPRDAVDHELVLVPSARAVHDLAAQFGYETVTLAPDFKTARGKADYRGASDYRKGHRRAFLCRKQGDFADLVAPVETLPEARPTVKREAWRDTSFGH